MRVAFIGLGVMGRPMAGHLQKAGHTLRVVRHRSPIPEQILAAGAVVCTSPAEAAGAADVLILMLPDTPEVEAVLFGQGGAIEALRAGSCVVDMSSIDPVATRTFAERVRALGSEYMDAPVSGGEVGARSATLTIMCGASAEVFDRMRPLLEVMGKSITRVGDVGDGQVAKVANQIIVALNIAAVSEALVFAARAGADPAKVRAALMGGFAASRVLEVHGQRMIDRAFAPGFRIALHQKDLNLALSAGRSLGIPLPGTAAVQQLFTACAARGEAQSDHSALIRVFEASAADHVSQFPAPSSGDEP